MRRLLLFLTIVIATWAALQHTAGLEPLPDYVLRDTLILLLALTAVSAWAAHPAPAPRATVYGWHNAGRALFGAGALTALAGGMLPMLAPAAAAYAPIVWAVGLALAVAGALWRGAVVSYAPPAVRWERDAAGHIVRKPLSPADDTGALGRRGWVALGLLLAVAVALRFVLALRAPGYCVGSECDLLLATTSGAPRTTLFTQQLVTWLAPWTGDPLRALRLASAFSSSLALFALVPALLQLLSPGGVLLGVALAGMGAWAATPWPEAALCAPLVVWGASAGAAGRGGRAWAAAGLALGLAAVAAPALLGAWLLWLAVLVIVAASPREGGRGAALAALLLGALAGGATLLANPAALMLLPAALPGRVQLWTQAAAIYATLIAPGTLGLIAPAVLGVGAALRAGRRGAVLLSGAAALALWLLLLPDGGAQWPLLIPVLLLLAALGADQILRAALHAGRPLARARALVAAGLAVALLVALPGLWRSLRAPQVAGDAASTDMAQAVAALITNAQSLATPTGGPVLLVPAPLLAQPTLRMAAASATLSGRVQGFNLQTDLPFAGDAPNGITYVLAVDDATALQELLRVYPAGVAAPAQINPALPALTTFSVDGKALEESRGLLQWMTSGQGATHDSANAADLISGVGPLAFGWAAYPPQPPPFGAAWSGSLRVRDRGDYTFSVESAAGALFSMLLDGRLILDTSAGLIRFSDALATGDYALDMRYTSGSTPGDLRVLWQPPGQEPTPIPRAVLHNPTIPTIGLVGSYTSGALWDGALLAQRKDRIIAADPALPAPWSVLWQGQLAAPRAGEYLIGGVSNGALIIEVDGQTLVTHIPDGASESGSDPAEGTIYLSGGWTPITVRYATGNESERAPEVNLYWQPPGSGPAPLAVEHLYPSVAPLTAGDVALPALPSVVDPLLGDEGFALSSDVSYWQPQTRIPPRALPPLNMQRVAEFGACGASPAQLDAPHGLAWDAARQLLYVADTGNRRVLALGRDAEGALQAQIVPLTEMEEPVDVAVAPSGLLYVLDTVAPRLVEYDPATSAARSLALGESFYRPRGLDVDAAGLLYIADTGGARVAVVQIAPDSDQISIQAQFGGPGTPLGAGQPVDVAAARQGVWTIGADHGRLWRLDTLGSLTATRLTDTINGPHLAHLDDGRLLLSDPALRRVLLLSAQGRPLAALGDEGAFAKPTGIAAWQTDSNLMLAVADTAACSVTLWQGAMP